MSYNNISASLTPTFLHRWLDTSRRSLWLGTLSFEDRCSASLAILGNNNLRINQGIALCYPTQVHPSTEDKERRTRNWEVFNSFTGRVCLDGIEQIRVDPYSYQELQNIVEKVVFNSDVEFIIFDITCMTKVHTLALATILTQCRQSLKWAVAYSIPENYGNFDNIYKAPGWRDVIIAPLAETALLFNEAHSRGIIIPGHEADRLIMALAELEPSGGIILIAETPSRPDLRYMSERLNQKVIRQLTRMRSSSWTTRVIGGTHLEALRSYVNREISLAKEYQAPVIFFPYGPKSLVFCTATQLFSEYAEASWFVYPVPSAYDVNYSEGVEKTIWLTPEPISDV